LLDCFVKKTGPPVTRLAILDVTDVEQRTKNVDAWMGPHKHKEFPPLEMPWWMWLIAWGKELGRTN
jgi:hypothetical protein